MKTGTMFGSKNIFKWMFPVCVEIVLNVFVYIAIMRVPPFQTTIVDTDRNIDSREVFLSCHVLTRLQGLLYDVPEINTQPDISKNIATKASEGVVVEEVQPGGINVQKYCAFSQKVAIIIPYRDRKEHLETIVKHLHRMLQMQRVCYGIYVSELANPTIFNKGLLMNVGYITTKNEEKYDFYVFHNVDLIPVHQRNVYICDDTPKHMASYNSKYTRHYGMEYNTYTGGVLALNDTQFRAVNGFSNLLFGWVSEDDVMYDRFKTKRLGLKRVIPEIGRYYALPHGPDKGNPDDRTRFDRIGKILKGRNDGITSLAGLYQLLKVEKRSLYTWIYIRCNQTDIMLKHRYIFG